MIIPRRLLCLSSAAAVVLAVALMVVTSCRSSKTTAPAPGTAWETVYLPVKVSLAKPTSFSLSGRATIERDRGINVSMRVLGMEAASLTVVNDSVYVIDRYHKYAFAEPLSTMLGSRAGKYTMSDVISILLGQKSVPENPYVTVTAEDMTASPAGNVAGRISIDSDSGSGRFACSVELKYRDAEWNTGRSVRPPSIPGKYKRIDLETLRRLLKSFKI